MDGAVAMNEVIHMKNSWHLILVVLLACNWHIAFGEDIDVRVQVDEISRSALVSNKVNRENIERQFLNLLSGNSNSASRATVYAAVARMYGGDMEHHSEKIAHYARESLKNQIDEIDACDMYLYLGMAADVQARRGGTTPNAAELENQVTPYIRGLAFGGLLGS